jgi:hypothetical protein
MWPSTRSFFRPTAKRLREEIHAVFPCGANWLQAALNDRGTGTVLYAAPSDLSDESMELFKTIVSKTLDDDSYGHQKISPLIFRFDRGELVGALIVKQVEQ